MMRLAIGVVAAIGLAGCNSQQPIGETATMGDNSAIVAAQAESEPGKLWVKTDRAVLHSCPSEKCGTLNTLMFREAATPLETKGGWSRVTKLYSAGCTNGRIDYIKKGDARCVASNGYIDGQVAEWVRTDQLVAVRPRDPAADAAADEKLVAQSDDFQHYHKQFAAMARKLISDGRCTEADFNEQGGFMKSVTTYGDEPVYFTYCGGMTASNRIYVNGKTGTIM